MINSGDRSKRIVTMLAAFVTIFFSQYMQAMPAHAQTKIPPPGADIGIDGGGGPTVSPGAAQTQSTDPSSPYYSANGYTTMIQQAAEQNTQGVITNTNNQLLQGSELGQYNDVYAGVSKFWGDDIVSNLFQNIGQLIGRWLSELVNGWISDTVQFLTAFLRTFVLNPNIAVNGLNQNPLGANGSNKNDDISPYIRQGADVMYGIAVDLLLLLFILCIWKFWADAAWKGGSNMMGAVGRLIFTAGLLLAWPTIYAFEIQITNEMIKAVYFNSSDQVAMLDAAMSSTVKGGLVATAGLLANAFAPVIGTLAGGGAAAAAGSVGLGTVGGIVAFAGLIIYVTLGAVLIAELVYIIVLKAVQTALLTAQYMFAPIFIVFFATPDTEDVCSGFVRSFVEVSLWTFVWVGLLKIMVIVLFSDFNPWGKIIMSIGVLQLMIQVPGFLARAQISPASDFISAGLVTTTLTSAAGALGNFATSKTGQAVDYMMNQRFAARGLAQSQKVNTGNLPTSLYDKGLLGAIRNGAQGNLPSGTPPPKHPDINPKKPGSGGIGPDGKPVTNPATGPRKPGGQGEPNDPKNKNKIDPTTGKPFKTHEPPKPGSQGTTQTPSGGSATQTAKGAASTALNRLGRGGKIAAGAALAGGAIAAIGAMPPRGKQQSEQAEKERKLKEAKENAEQMLANEQKENTNLKTGNDKSEDEKRKNAKAFAAQHLKGQAAQQAHTLLNKAEQDAAAGSGTTSASLKAGKGKAASGTTGAMTGGGTADPKLTVANAVGANQTHGPRRPGSAGSPKPSEAKLNLGGIAIPTAKNQQEQNKRKGTNEQIDAESDPVKSADPINQERDQRVREEAFKGADPKLDVKGTLLGNVPGPPLAKPKVPGRDAGAASKRTGADGTTTETTRIGPAKNGKQHQQGKGQTPKVPETGKAPGLNRGNANEQVRTGRGQNVDQEVEQGAEQAQNNTAEGLRIGTVVRPVVPTGTRAAHEKEKSLNTKGTTSAGAAKTTGGVSQNVKQGSVTVGKGIAGGPGGGRPIVPPDGGRLAPGKSHVNSERTAASSREQEIEADANLVTSFDALGQPVTVRINTRQQQPASTAQRLQNGNLQQVGQARTTLGGITAAPAARAAMRPPAASNLVNGGRTGTGAALASTALHSSAVTQGLHIDPSTSNSLPDQGWILMDAGGNGGGVAPPNPGANPPLGVFDKFAQSNYRWVPPRNLGIAIRTAQGPTMGPSPNGQAHIVGDGKGRVNHVRFGANATPEQKAMQLIAAGYAQTFSSDDLAFDAARESAIVAGEDAPKTMTERIAAGYMAANGKSFKQSAVAKQRFSKSLFKHAVLGAEAYVAGQDGNAFTEYLRGRYGEMTPEQAAWGVHVMTDETSPESPWNPKIETATDRVSGTGLPMTAGNRAAASNSSVLKHPQWASLQAIQGVQAYSASIVNSKCPEGVHPLVKDAMIGREAPAVSPPEVSACLAIMLESPSTQAGEEACANIPLVQKVAELGSSGGAKDYRSAYLMMKTIGNLSGGPSSRGGTQTLHAAAAHNSGLSGQSGSGSVSIGGGYGGNAGAQTNLVDVNVDGSNQSFSAVPPVPPPAGGLQARLQTEFNYRPAQNMGGTQRYSVNMPVQGSMSGASDVRTSRGGGHNPITNRIELDVSGTIMPGQANIGNIHNLVPPTQQHARQQIDVNLGGVGGGNASPARYSINAPVSGQSSSAVDIRLAGDGGQSDFRTNESVVDVYSQAAGGQHMQAASSADINAAAAQAANSTRNSIYDSHAIVMAMHTAGFTDDQIQDPRIAASALDVYRQDSSMLGTAAITAKIMGPQGFSHGSTQTVQMMIDAGCSSNTISRPDVYTARDLIAGGGHPSPNNIRTARLLQQYSPRLESAPQFNLAAEVARTQTAATTRDAFVRGFR